MNNGKWAELSEDFIRKSGKLENLTDYLPKERISTTILYTQEIVRFVGRFQILFG